MEDHATQIASAITENSSGTGKILWNPINGPGPLGEDIASTFRSSTYTESILESPTSFYRYYGGASSDIGGFWTATKPSGALQGQLDSAILSEFGNTFNGLVEIKIPQGSTVFEGIAGPQTGNMKPYETLMGGGNQVYIPKVDPNWIVK